MTWYPTLTKAPTNIVLLLWPLLLYFLSCSDGKTVGDHAKNITCIDKERKALLKFKKQIQYDNCDMMVSWRKNTDCCTWNRVSCSNRTGHVIGLDLGAKHHKGCLESGAISPSLGELMRLESLDLSSNLFYDATGAQRGQNIPSFIVSLVSLRHLNLSNSLFSGVIPNDLENLTLLTSLDLSNNFLSSKSLNWLSQLTLLKDVNLGHTDLRHATDWSQNVASLPLLEVLKMDFCGISTLMPLSSLQHTNFRFISLSGNAFSRPPLLQWLFHTTHPAQIGFSSLERSLTHLNLSSNSLKGSIPDSIGNFKSLITLDLSYNSLSGTIPDEIGNLKSLSYCNLYHNSLSGSMPDTIGNLASLTHLDLSYNFLKGIIPTTIGNLESLTFLRLFQNSLSGTIPDTIGNLKSLTNLDFSKNWLEGIIPTRLWNLESLTYVRLSNNNLQGFIPSSIEDMKQISYIDLSNNRLQGPIPSAFGKLLPLSYLDLSNNHLEGSIASEMGDLHSMSHIDLSNNQLEGDIPNALGDPPSLLYLDLSNNHLEGTIPSAIAKLEYLIYLDLSNNDLSGSIPCQFGFFQLPPNVNFSFNDLSGPIPKYLSSTGLEAFKGNPDLRGVENIMCEEADRLENDGEGDDRIYLLGLYVSIGLGFFAGFRGFCGTLTMKNSWRRAYFKLLDHMINKICM